LPTVKPVVTHSFGFEAHILSLPFSYVAMMGEAVESALSYFASPKNCHRQSPKLVGMMKEVLFI